MYVRLRFGGRKTKLPHYQMSSVIYIYINLYVCMYSINKRYHLNSLPQHNEKLNNKIWI